MFNPAVTLPFCPDQTDFLCFKGPYGFGALDLNLVEGFNAGAELIEGKGVNPEMTTIHLTNGSEYISVESVPVLVARFAAVKKLRYAPERADSERCEKNPIVQTPAPTTVVVAAPAKPEVPPQASAAAKPASYWTKP